MSCAKPRNLWTHTSTTKMTFGRHSTVCKAKQALQSCLEGAFTSALAKSVSAAHKAVTVLGITLLYIRGISTLHQNFQVDQCDQMRGIANSETLATQTTRVVMELGGSVNENSAGSGTSKLVTREQFSCADVR